jgi:twitching motility protein PilT
MVLSGVVTQKLVPSLVGGRVPVCEILLGSSSVRNSIREGNTHLIDNIIQTSKEAGMILFEDNLKELVSQNLISHETALNYALRPERYLQLIKG